MVGRWESERESSGFLAKINERLLSGSGVLLGVGVHVRKTVFSLELREIKGSVFFVPA